MASLEELIAQAYGNLVTAGERLTSGNLPPIPQAQIAQISPTLQQATDLTSQLLTEIYAPIWQKGSEVKIIDDCISDANIILALVQRCSSAGDIRVRLRNEEIPMEFDVEW